MDKIDTGGTIGLTVTLDVPKLDVEVQQIHNVTFNCDPAQSSTPSNQVYQNLTQLVPSIGFDALEVFSENASVLGDSLASENQNFQQNYSSNLSTTCYFFDTAKETLGPAPPEKPATVSSATSATSATSAKGTAKSIAKSIHIPLVEYYMAVAMMAFLVM